jgi:hypothetical protein
MAKVAFNRKETLFTIKLDADLRKKLKKCCVWSTAFYAAETWTLRKLYRKYVFRVYIFEKESKYTYGSIIFAVTLHFALLRQLQLLLLRSINFL